MRRLLAISLVLFGCREAPAIEPVAEIAAPAESPPSEVAPETAKGLDAPRTEARETKHLDQDCEPPAAGDKPLALVKLQLTSNVAEREPVDELAQAKVGEHVWAYLEVANGSEVGRCVSVVFRVDGGKRAALTLDVGPSPRWRTWAKNRIAETDAGKSLEIEIRDDRGRVLETRKLRIEKP
jgi:hypothetical protein